MKVTSIKRQTNNSDRVSIFIDGTYGFSLSLNQWQESGLKSGDAITESELERYKKQSDFGKLFDKALRYLARRRRSEREMRQYLKRKDVAIEEIEQILHKLHRLKYLDDEEFARAWVRDRNLLKPSSNRKLRAELRQKGIDQSVIDTVLATAEGSEQENLRRIIANKRRQRRYQDDTKLIAYLTRQGFPYQEVISRLNRDETEN